VGASSINGSAPEPSDNAGSYVNIDAKSTMMKGNNCFILMYLKRLNSLYFVLLWDTA
jgi:hypothetical protein